MPKRSLRSGRGALIVIGTLFLLSVSIRLTGDAGQALAREVAALTGSSVEDQTACAAPPGIAEALSAILERERQAADRELAITDRMAALQLAEDRVTVQLRELREAEEALRATIAMAEDAAESDVAQLTAVYENMKPKDSAAVFAQMTPDFAAGFLARMRPDAAAAILSGLEPSKAYSISVLLAGRNASVPTE
jgi:flagellar motility protein MotE (MotC chaperone)